MLLELKSEITYGPVSSRRLGRSLGINLLPARRKVCTFDCVYCQYGWTRCFDVAPVASTLPSVEEMVAAVTAALKTLDPLPAWLTFSGNGEATLHPRFPEMVDALLRLRDRLSPGSLTAILSNSTQAGEPAIRAALARLDARIMKLDAGDEEMLRAYNRPAPGVSYGKMLDGLAALDDLTIQTLIAAGPGGNDASAHVERWLAQVRALSPSAVQLYTLDRSAPARSLRPAALEQLDAIADQLTSTGISATVYLRTEALQQTA
jgi:wyosine [tRNA(Phe)-imidazoG37] synthetase (radical SAM superfamily)